MDINKLGEDGFISFLQSRFNAHLPKNVLAGIGDDCAVIKQSETRAELITSDLLIENEHFTIGQISPEELGHKALSINLSDIAGMGGTPKIALISLGIPKTTDTDWLKRFFSGVQKPAKKYQVHLLGGDLSKSEIIVINVTIIGKAHPKNIRYRNGAIPGDIICTTGPLGNAGAGLKILQEEISLSEKIRFPLIKSQIQPDPHLKIGNSLAKHPEVHAMMDLSDGLAADLSRLITASKVGAIIHVENLPLSLELQEAAKICRWDPHELAISSGEDYCLLLTIERDAFSALQKQCPFPLFAIGEIIKDPKSLTYLDHGKEISPPKGFDHFLNEDMR